MAYALKTKHYSRLTVLPLTRHVKSTLIGVVFFSSAASCHFTKLLQYVNLISNTGCLLTFWFPGFCYKLSFSSLTPTFPSHSLCPSLPTHFPYPPLVKPQPLVTVSPSTLSLMGNVLFFVNILSPSTLVVCIFCNVMVGFLKPFVLGKSL